MAELDRVIQGALIVDGSGSPAFEGDVGLREGRIAKIRSASHGGPALTGKEMIDGAGLVLTPGFIDPHTHYDAQLGWDPTASPSNLHGVTTASAKAKATARNDRRLEFLPKPKESKGMATSRQTMFTRKLIA